MAGLGEYASAVVAEYITIDQAATALGVTGRALRRLAQAGKLPEAKFVGDRWVVSYQGLPSIATRECFALDLTDAGGTEPSPIQVLEVPPADSATSRLRRARAQLAEAKQENEALLQQVKDLKAIADRETDEQDSINQYVDDLESYADQIQEHNDVLRRRVDDLHIKLEEEKYERSALAARCKQLAEERNDFAACLGWLGQHKLAKRKAGRQRFRESINGSG